jgi:hypothetical protein
LSNNNEKLTEKAMIQQIKQNEKDAISKAESDARQALKTALENKEQAIIKAKAEEEKAIRDVLAEADNNIRVIRETALKAIDEAKKTRGISVKTARDIEEKTVRDAYDAESKGLIGVDTKTARRIKHETLITVQRAKIDRERAIRQALLDEDNTINKALDIASRDKKRAEESRKRAIIYVTNDARAARLKAIQAAADDESRTVNEILVNHKKNLEAIKKQTQESLSALKTGEKAQPKAEKPEEPAIEQTIAAAEQPENKPPAETEESPKVEIAAKPEAEETPKAEIAAEPEAAETVEEQPSQETLEMEPQLPPEAEKTPEEEITARNETGEIIQEQAQDREETEENKEPLTGAEKNEAGEPIDEALKEDKKATVKDKGKSALYKGMMKVFINAPAEPLKIKALGEKLNDIENLRVLVISGGMGKNTEVTLSLNEDMPLIDILNSIPEVAGVTIKGKDIQLTLNQDTTGSKPA